MKRTLKPDDYLELWPYFSNRGDSYKDKLWNITIWLYALLTGILGYMISNFTSLAATEEVQEVAGETASSPLITEPTLAIVFALFALLFCLYIILTIKEYGEHIQHNWNRANHLLEKIQGLPKIWYSGLKQQEIDRRLEENAAWESDKFWLFALALIPRRLIYLTIGMMLIFVVIGGLAIWELLD